MTYYSVKYTVDLITHTDYGYLTFTEERGIDPKKLFPENEFTVVFNGKKILNRKYEPKRRRVNLYPIRHMLYKGQILIITRKNDTIYIDSED